MKNFRELDIFQDSKRLAILVHNLSMTLPRFEMFEEGSQIRRASKAVTTSIVEGYGRRRYKADFVRYLTYSQSECDEMIIHLEFLFRTNSFTDKEVYENLKNEYDCLSRRINKFIQWVETHEIY